MTPEAGGCARDRLWEGPVLDVCTSPIGMKKNRPGTLLTCLCRKEDADPVVKLLFRHTSTLGVRETECRRYTLQRTVQTVPTDLGRCALKKRPALASAKKSWNSKTRRASRWSGASRFPKRRRQSSAPRVPNVRNKPPAGRQPCKSDYVRKNEYDAAEKLDLLKNDLLSMERLAVAFSGGVDSTFLLQGAFDVLHDRTIAVIVRSALFPGREYNEAAAFAEQLGVKRITADFEESEVAGFSENPADRCYLCKKALFSAIQAVAAENGIPFVADGSNLDDTGDYRPGMAALKELGIVSPLKDAGLTKADIRALSYEMGLSTWEKPSFACLATRFPYGQKITKETLSMVDQAEQFPF
jgi:uncharacterized protein